MLGINIKLYDGTRVEGLRKKQPLSFQLLVYETFFHTNDFVYGMWKKEKSDQPCLTICKAVVGVLSDWQKSTSLTSKASILVEVIVCCNSWHCLINITWLLWEEIVRILRKEKLYSFLKFVKFEMDEWKAFYSGRWLE